jgi:Glutamine synthetase, catalytic domain
MARRAGKKRHGGPSTWLVASGRGRRAGTPEPAAAWWCLGDALDALEADRELTDVLGEYLVTSFLAYKRNEIERFERFVTDWEFREYAYHF